jgi:hypothetical protein
MGCSVFVYLKKMFSLTLMLNSFITIAAITGILYGFYFAWPGWKPYTPWLISGNFFLLAAMAALINVFPSASIGRALHTGRLFFHHYVYGFFVLIFSTIYILAFTSVSLVTLFLVNTGNIAINTGRLFVLTGATLFLDDLPDVSKRVESTLNKIKSQAFRVRKAFHVLQLLTGVVTLYIFLAILSFSIYHLEVNIANFLTMGTLLITSFTSFACVKRKAWLKITPPQMSQQH